MKPLPPLSALRAFEAVLRTGSVTKAGAELNVTHAAISQQLRNLETHLGVRLLDRSGRRLQPTPDGAALGAALSEGFNRISAAVAALQLKAEATPLRITTTANFASTWLIPRLGRFRAKHPDIEVLISSSRALVDMEAGDFDLAIRYSAEDPPGLESRPLLFSRFAVLGAPSLVGTERVSDLTDLYAYPWLLEPSQPEFLALLESRGLDTTKHRNRVTLEATLHYSALLNGQGISMMALELVRTDIDAGRLTVLLDDLDPRQGTGYRALWLARYERPALRKFIAWLSSQ